MIFLSHQDQVVAVLAIKMGPCLIFSQDMSDISTKERVNSLAALSGREGKKDKMLRITWQYRI